MRRAGLAVALLLLTACARQPEGQGEWTPDPNLLIGAWQILEPAAADSPPAEGIAFRPNATAVLLGPRGGGVVNWELRADSIFLSDPQAEPGAPGMTALRVAELTDTSLVLATPVSSRRFTRALLGELAGTAALEGDASLPAGATLTVVLEDVTAPDAPVEMGREVLSEMGPPPISFRLPYIATAIDPQRAYALRAWAEGPSGRLQQTPSGIPVITAGAAEPIEVILKRVR